MTEPQTERQTIRPGQSRSSARRLTGVVVALLALGGSFVAVALALASATPATVEAAANAKLGKQVVVNAQGRTLYALSPETTHHLLCTSRECLKFWPPLTVPSKTTRLKAGPGVQGHLGILHRRNGMLQVTLRGMPLYRFSHDRAKGEANGEGIESFGGTWHAMAASTSGSITPSDSGGAPTTPATTPSTPPSSTPTTPTETPGYYPPGY